MADNKYVAPGVTKFSDHEVIVLPNRLKRKAITSVAADEPDPLWEAEEALGELSVQFGSWMVDECTALERARHLVQTEGSTAATREALHRAAHDIRGHGATLGFPMAADVAGSLCLLLEQSSDPSHIPLSFIDQCVDAIRAIVREHNGPHADRIAAALAQELRNIADALMAGGTSRDRTDSERAGALVSPKPAR
jgi:chemotaxis protein histidine kinase CheA